MQRNDIVISHKSVHNIFSYRLIERVNKDGSVSLVGGTSVLRDTIEKRPTYSHIPFDHPSYFIHWQNLVRLINNLIQREERFSTENTATLEQLRCIREAALNAYPDQPVNKVFAPMDNKPSLHEYLGMDLARQPDTSGFMSYSPAVSRTNPIEPTPTQEETDMSTIIVKQTLIHGHVLEKMNHSELLDQIRKLEEQDKSLAAISTESTAIAAMRAEIKEALNEVVVRLDSLHARK